MTPKQTINRRFNNIERTTKAYLDYIDNNLDSILARGYKQPDWYSTQSRFTVKEFVDTTKRLSEPLKIGTILDECTTTTSITGQVQVMLKSDYQVVKAVAEYMFYDCLNTGEVVGVFSPKHRKEVRRALYRMYCKYK